jgi:hypothetical protein
MKVDGQTRLAPDVYRLCGLLLEFSKCSVDKMNSDCTFADGRSDSLYVPRPNITHGEYPRKTRFQHLRTAGQRPGRLVSGTVEIASRENESFGVERDTTLQPFGSRRCAGHDENVSNGDCGDFAGLVIATCDVLEVRIAFERDDFGAVMNFDVGILQLTPDTRKPFSVTRPAGGMVATLLLRYAAALLPNVVRACRLVR